MWGFFFTVISVHCGITWQWEIRAYTIWFRIQQKQPTSIQNETYKIHYPSKFPHTLNATSTKKIELDRVAPFVTWPPLANATPLQNYLYQSIKLPYLLKQFQQSFEFKIYSWLLEDYGGRSLVSEIFNIFHGFENSPGYTRFINKKNNARDVNN